MLSAMSCHSLSTKTLVQKLLVYMKHFLIRLEINISSSGKFDGDMNIFWNEEDLCPCSVREGAHTSVQ